MSSREPRRFASVDSTMDGGSSRSDPEIPMRRGRALLLAALVVASPLSASEKVELPAETVSDFFYSLIAGRYLDAEDLLSEATRAEFRGGLPAAFHELQVEKGSELVLVE